MMEREDKEDQKKRDARSLELLILRLTSQPTLSFPTPKRQRTIKRKEVRYMEPDGTIAMLTLQKTFWYLYYVLNGMNLTSHGLKKFRRRFRLPYDNFRILLLEMEDHHLFLRWKTGTTDLYQSASSPLSLSYFLVHYVTLAQVGRLTTLKSLQP